jgi:hypothetical protein
MNDAAGWAVWVNDALRVVGAGAVAQAASASKTATLSTERRRNRKRGASLGKTARW